MAVISLIIFLNIFRTYLTQEILQSQPAVSLIIPKPIPSFVFVLVPGRGIVFRPATPLFSAVLRKYGIILKPFCLTSTPSFLVSNKPFKIIFLPLFNLLTVFFCISSTPFLGFFPPFLKAVLFLLFFRPSSHIYANPCHDNLLIKELRGL